MEKLKVSVRLAYSYDPYEMDEHIVLGQTDWQTAVQALQKTYNYKPSIGTCIENIDANLSCDTGFSKHYDRQEPHATLDLSSMFFPMGPHRAPCMAANAKVPQTDENMTKMCAHNFRCGKCQDKFMRETIGAILYPQLYTNQKVK